MRSHFRTARMASTAALLVSLATSVQAQTITWKGHSWRLTSGGMAGVCQGNPANVSVDANGYLHMRITNSGGTWTAAELFTTERLGFGTYHWQIDAPIDRLDQNVVLGLFPYGPNGPRTNEIDIEYAFWGHPDGVNGDWVVYPASGTTVGAKSYRFSLNGATPSTSRFIWSSTRVDSFLMGGLAPVGSTAGLIDSWTYTPPNPTVNIPQQALPLGMNLWCFETPPSNGQNVEVIIRDFQFVPEGTPIDAGTPGTGGMGGGGAAGAGGSAGKGGAAPDAGVADRGGNAGRGGAGAGGASGNGGASGSGGAAGKSGAAGSSGATGGSATTSGATGAGGATTGSTTSGATSGSGSTSAATTTTGAGGVPGTGGTSSSGTGGTSGAGSHRAGSGNDEPGCGCRSTSRDASGYAAFLFGSLLVLFTRRFRRRRV